MPFSGVAWSTPPGGSSSKDTWLDGGAAQISQADVEKLAMADASVQKFTNGLTVRKVIYVPGKLLNIVAN